MSPIAASELIINGQCAIYHLALAPHQLAPTVITVGDPGRVARVSQHFSHITHRAAHREFVTHTGICHGLPISVISSGIGPDNIDIVLNELDALANIDFATRLPHARRRSLRIIRLGTCGGLQPDVPVDSLVVSDHGIGLDNLLYYYEHRTTAADGALLEAFAAHTGLAGGPVASYIAPASALKDYFTDGYHHGITATCPGFYGPQGRQLGLVPAYPDLPARLSSFRHEGQRITNFEMETSALYGLGQLMGHQCLSVSVIVANRALGTFSANGDAAVDELIARSLEVICRMPAPEPGF